MMTARVRFVSCAPKCTSAQAFTASPVHDDGERLLGTNGLKRAHLIIRQVRLSPLMTGRMKNGLHHTTKEGAIR